MTRREMNRTFLAMLVGLAATGSASKLNAETTPALNSRLRGENVRADGIQTLIKESLAKQITKPVIDMITLTMPPGSAAGPHQHTGQVFAYILEGELENQVEPGPAKKYRPGDYFYEPPMHIHKVMRNLSSTKPVKLLIVQVEQQGVPFTIAA